MSDGDYYNFSFNSEYEMQIAIGELTQRNCLSVEDILLGIENRLRELTQAIWSLK